MATALHSLTPAGRRDAYRTAMTQAAALVSESVPACARVQPDRAALLRAANEAMYRAKSSDSYEVIGARVYRF